MPTEKVSLLPKKCLTEFPRLFIIRKARRGVAKFGIALGSGPRGLGFESRHSDQKPSKSYDFDGFSFLNQYGFPVIRHFSL